jgi:hypothetical protein
MFINIFITTSKTVGFCFDDLQHVSCWPMILKMDLTWGKILKGKPIQQIKVKEEDEWGPLRCYLAFTVWPWNISYKYWSIIVNVLILKLVWQWTEIIIETKREKRRCQLIWCGLEEWRCWNIVNATIAFMIMTLLDE